MQLNPVREGTFLKSDAIYQINGSLYRYTGKDPYARSDHPKYDFSPLPGQKAKADLKINSRQLLSKVYEVEGMLAGRYISVINKSVQLSLF